MFVRRLFPLTLAALLLAFPIAARQKRKLTLDELFDPARKVNFSGTIPRIVWHPDGVHYLIPGGADGVLQKIEAATGRSVPFYDPSKVEAGLKTAGMSPENAKMLSSLTGADFKASNNTVLLNDQSDLYYCELETGQALRLTNTPTEEEEVESLSPDGRLVAFVRKNNLYVVNTARGRERMLTGDGNPTLLNGILDWVYEEEVYGRGVRQAYWWSPNSSEIAFLQINESHVPKFTVTDDVPAGQGLETTNYPRAGEPNPTVKLGVVNVARGAQPRWVDLSPYQSSEFLVTRVGWTPDGSKTIFQVQNREQTWLDLNTSESATGKTVRLLREEGTAWIDVVELPAWCADGTFLWQSDRTGWRHLYRYAADGKLLNAVTKGEWDVRDLHGVSNDGWAYFSGTKRSYVGQDVFRARIDGSNQDRLSKDEGTHQANFNPQFTAYVDTWSTAGTPPRVGLFKNTGEPARTIEENKVKALDDYRWGTVEFLKVPTRDGFEMEAVMIKPPDFDPAKKYPVMSHTYGGPGAPSVKNAWGGRNYLWHQVLAQKGYVVWICDNRSASSKGPQSAYPIHRNLGELELRDLEDGLAYLKKLPYVDGSRIGIWGWSYGGYMTAYALTHSVSFKIGIAGAPVTDWHNYDTIYTERYMGLPRNNPEGYRKSSVTEAAGNLRGKLLLIHGLTDDNVHLQNSIQFMDALQKANKPFEVMFYPQSRHGVTNPQRVRHMYETMTRFIEENL